MNDEWFVKIQSTLDRLSNNSMDAMYKWKQAWIGNANSIKQMNTS